MRRYVMTRNILLYILVLIFLFACATPQKYDARLNRLIGQKVSVLQKDWGTPSAKKILDDGGMVITYTKADNVFVPSEFYVYNQSFQDNPDMVYQPFVTDYDFAPYGESFGYEVKYVCQTTFLVQNGIITGWKWKGNDCLAD